MDRESVVRYVRQHGPLLPVKVSKELDTNILFASAILGELVSNKKLKLTSVKSGGSPFYYADGQEYKLQELSDFLKGKEKEAYEFIKNESVVRDKTAEPWQRVALRHIKDYAVPVEVEFKGEIEVFWKWYLLNKDQVKEKIGSLLGGVNEEPIKEVEPVKQEIKKISETLEGPVVENRELPKVQETLKPIKRVKKASSGFYKKVGSYIDDFGITVVEEETLRKGKEYLFNVFVPSRIGRLNYLLVAKDKKTINDSDLVLAMNEGKIKKLPVLFISTGSLTKKGELYLKKHIGDLLVFKEI